MKYAGAILSCVLVLGCGPSTKIEGDGGVDPNAPDAAPIVNGTLRVEPADQEVTVSGGIPAELDYQAIVTFDDGTMEDVTGDATFTILNGQLGAFSGAHFTSAIDRGGTTKVRASARGKIAETNLTVRLETVIIGPGAPGDAPGKFGGAEDPGRAPQLVYPNDGVLVPPNLNELEFHFMPGAGNTLFELTFQGTALELKVYFTCQTLGAGCAYLPDETVWTILAEAERGQPLVTYRLRGVDGANPGTVGTSADRQLGFGEEDMVGGLYYWNAGAGAIRRYDFGRRGQTAENYIDAARAGAMTCVGCHVLSRQGDRIAVGLDIPAPSPYKVYDVATRTQIYQQGSAFGGGGSNFFSFSPDSAQILTSNGVTIAWRDAMNGTAYADPLVNPGAMPDWSPDGSKMVFAKPAMAPPCFGGFCGATGVDSASLEILPFDGSTWGAATTLVPFSGQNNYYPAFSPDGTWVMFNRSPSNLNSYDAADAQVWVVAVPGGTPVQLANASTGGDSWPKWAQIVQLYQGRSLMWITFSSRRAYGLRKGAGEPAQLWMAAFDPGRAEILDDPSYPAFWLPFQEADSGNHIAQWTLEVERQPCTSDGQCPTGEFCEGGVCVPVIP